MLVRQTRLTEQATATVAGKGGPSRVGALGSAGGSCPRPTQALAYERCVSLPHFECACMPLRTAPCARRHERTNSLGSAASTRTHACTLLIAFTFACSIACTRSRCQSASGALAHTPRLAQCSAIMPLVIIAVWSCGCRGLPRSSVTSHLYRAVRHVYGS